MAPQLLILAAGLGSRFGGLKQLAAVGPDGQTMLDYAVVDAARAGFGTVVFLIRPDFDQAFRQQVGERAARHLEVRYAYQTPDTLPAGWTAPANRRKPWGTGHAVWCARRAIDAPFAVINADDFYGRPAYAAMADHLAGIQDPDTLHMAMVGYPLENTLSPNGAVNRGICQLAGSGLAGVEEVTGIRLEADGRIRGDAPDGTRRLLAPDALASLAFWGFTPALFPALEGALTDFLREHGDDPEAECFLPAVVDRQLRAGTRCTVLTADSPWFGITHRDDQPRVAAALARLHQAGVYE
ncbi:MAG: nucleotidyltransferase family protein [Opitutales bacterium]